MKFAAAVLEDYASIVAQIVGVLVCQQDVKNASFKHTRLPPFTGLKSGMETSSSAKTCLTLALSTHLAMVVILAQELGMTTRAFGLSL